jgi:protein TonB
MKFAKLAGLVALAAMACGGTPRSSTSPAPPATQPEPVAPEKSAQAGEPTADRRVVRVRDIVQPVKIEKQDPVLEEGDPDGVEGGDPYGVEGGDLGGVEGGVVGGDLGGVVGAPPPPPPPPPPNMPPGRLEASRIAGDKNIVPDPDTKIEIARSGKDKLIGSYKMCLTAAGEVSAVMPLKSTGFADYDLKIQRTILHEWRYRPIVIDGKPSRVCTAITFLYSAEAAPAPKPAPKRPARKPPAQKQP